MASYFLLFMLYHQLFYVNLSLLIAFNVSFLRYHVPHTIILISPL